VACVEWNDLPFSPTTFDKTYQTMPETRGNYWNLIFFNQHEKRDGSVMWVVGKKKCMHFPEPGLPEAGLVEGAALPNNKGMRDYPIQEGDGRFAAGQMDRVRILHYRLPVQHSEVQFGNQARLQVHAVFRSGQPGAGAGLHQVVPDRLPALWQQRRHDGACPAA